MSPRVWELRAVHPFVTHGSRSGSGSGSVYRYAGAGTQQSSEPDTTGHVRHPRSYASVMGLDLADVVLRATNEGWATVTASAADFRKQALAGGFVEVAGRTGQEALQVLQPRRQSEARRRSLSALHGLGAQPLHTDGAHLYSPPDLVLLAAETPSSTPTLLWKPIESQWCRDDATTGVFLVDGGTRRFLASAEDATGLRFDPGCMSPRDPFARRLAAAIASASQHATEHRWLRTDELLIIGNRTALHARAPVSVGDLGRRLRRVAFCGTISR